MHAPEPRGKLRQVAAARGRHLVATCRDLQGARGKLRQLTATYRDICVQIGRAATCGNLRQLAVQTAAASCGNLPRLAIGGATVTCGKSRFASPTVSYGKLRQLAVTYREQHFAVSYGNLRHLAASSKTLPRQVTASCGKMWHNSVQR